MVNPMMPNPMAPQPVPPPTPALERERVRKVPKDEHRLERVVRLAVERFTFKFDELMRSMETTSGRPAFHRELSDEEKLERWFDPAIRQDTILKLQKVGGEEAVQRYVEDMTKLMMKQPQEEVL